MEDFIGPLIAFGIPAILLLLGLVIGQWNERSHFRALAEREAKLRHVTTTQTRQFIAALPGNLPPTLVVAEVVISSDYLKSFLAALKNLIGGEIRGFELLLERARREGILRLKEQAVAHGYNALINVRVETADIGGRENANRKNSIVMASIMVSGTAYKSG